MLVLNIKTGTLHTRLCAQGKLGFPPIDSKHMKNAISIQVALKEQRFRSVHKTCMVKQQNVDNLLWTPKVLRQS